MLTENDKKRVILREKSVKCRKNKYFPKKTDVNPEVPVEGALPGRVRRATQGTPIPGVLRFRAPGEAYALFFL